MSAFNEVVNWAKSLPKWQQSIVKGVLDGNMFDSVMIEKIAEWAIDDSELDNDMLDGFSDVDLSVEATRLISICELSNINNLQDGSNLEFSGSGLTVVYGQNGAGKSGYSRIIKKCCRSRDKDAEILGNVHSKTEKEQSAKIKYQVADEVVEYEWNRNSIPPADLQMIHVFDRSSGEVFLSKDADIQYKPSGMDLLDRLAEILPKVASVLQAKIEALTITDLSQIFQDYTDTDVYALISKLEKADAETKYNELSKLSEEELVEIDSLRRSIPLKEASSPVREREKLKRKDDSLRRVRDYILILHGALTNEKIEEANSKVDALCGAKKNAEKAKGLTFDSDKFLAGTGNEAWKVMWLAADRFAKEYAYVDSEYPSIGSKCVLCQQLIGDESASFMDQFGRYINDESQKILLKSQKALTDFIQQVKQRLKSPEDEMALFKTIEDSYPDIFCSLSVSVPAIKDTIADIISSVESLLNITQNDLALQKSTLLISEMDKIIQENKLVLEEQLNDEEYKKEIQADKLRQRSLSARKVLKQHEKIILDNINSFPLRKKLESVKSKCNTRVISNKTSELSNKYIIDSLSKCFNNELKQITGSRVEAVLLPSRTVQGVPHSKIVLQPRGGQPYNGKISEVLSEGEFRGVSLAGFFAELSMTDNTSAIVFDDPVSSLDHINAGRIADRIVEEVKKRQVIVFTHDILFVSYLMDKVDEKSISYITVESISQAGIVSEGLPFDKLSVSKRLKYLRGMLNSEIGPAYRKNNTEEYKQKAGVFYKLLRISWERAVEEILFGDAVKRYSREVNTRRLKGAKFSTENVDIINKNMTLCSGFLLHDPASGEEINFGKPEDLEAHLKELDDFAKSK